MNKEIILSIRQNRGNTATVQFYDLHGKKALSLFKTIPPGGPGFSMDVSGLPDGIYFVQVNIGKLSQIIKVRILNDG